MCIGVLFACLSTCLSIGLCLSVYVKVTDPPVVSGVTDSCALLCGCWKLSLDPLEEQLVLSATESSPQPLWG